MALQTLRRMASGGLYDQIGGGFARYSVDVGWTVPHFEKMLYDNALLARAYLHAWKITDDPLFRRVTEETLDWAVRELRQDEGGFASSLDADSEGVEGKFYVWTPAQVRAALPARPRCGMPSPITASPRKGTSRARTILTRASGDPAALASIKAGLLAARAARVRPALDDKRLTSWNALMIGVLAEAGAAFGRADYLAAAEACASFIEAELRAAGRVAAARVQPRRRQAAGLPRRLRVPARGVPDPVRVHVRRAVVRARDRARRGDPDPLPRPGARRLLLDVRGAHGADRAAQGPRGRPDPRRRLGGLLRPAPPGRA